MAEDTLQQQNTDSPEITEEPAVADAVDPISELPEIKEGQKISRFEMPDFKPGDTIKLQYKIIEGDKTRLQPYEGIVISKRGAGDSKTFVVRRIGVDGVGVERIFPLNSPSIVSLDILKHGKVRRAKLFYLRGKKGRSAMKIKESTK